MSARKFRLNFRSNFAACKAEFGEILVELDLFMELSNMRIDGGDLPDNIFLSLLGLLFLHLNPLENLG